MHKLLSHIIKERNWTPSMLTRTDLRNPASLKGTERVSRRLANAITGNEKIVVFGDYDMDGITSTLLLVDGLRRLGADVSYVIPKREDGYGLSREAVKDINCNVLITVDNGIAAADVIDDLPQDVIVLDHHAIPERVPNAYAIVNPELGYHTPLSGSGVAHAVLRSLYEFVGAYGNMPRLMSDIDLAGIGTMADAVPLVGENRALAIRALRLIQSGSRPGIQALKTVLGIKDPVYSRDVIWRIVPTLNSASRMIDDVGPVIELLSTRKVDTALRLADNLDRMNNARRELVQQHLSAVEDDVPIIVGTFMPGIIGLLAARYASGRKLAVVLSEDKDGFYRGSFRGDRSFDVLSSLSGMCESFGGHPGAGGLRIRKDVFPEWAERVREMASKVTIERRLPYEFIVPASWLTPESISELSLLEPFGAGNETPVMMVEGPASIVRSFRTRAGSPCHEIKVGGSKAIWWGATSDSLPDRIIVSYNSRYGLTLVEPESFAEASAESSVTV